VVLTFIDTDNFTAARAAIQVIQDRTVPGGAIVLDHFAGVDRFRYTLGERIAAKALLDDIRYLNLHGTGVLYR
jgi:O-methyltransferase